MLASGLRRLLSAECCGWARWAYRGQGDFEWPLIAKALRKGAGLTYGLPSVTTSAEKPSHCAFSSLMSAS